MDELLNRLRWTVMMMLRGQNDTQNIADFIEALDAYVEAKLKEKNS